MGLFVDDRGYRERVNGRDKKARLRKRAKTMKTVGEIGEQASDKLSPTIRVLKRTLRRVHQNASDWLNNTLGIKITPIP